MGAPEVVAIAKEITKANTKKCTAKTISLFKTSAAQDVFSLGVAMFMTLFGFPPFECAKDSDRNYQDLHGTLDAFKAKLIRWGVCPAKSESSLLPLLLKMMHKDVASRPSLAAILKSLDEIESGAESSCL